MTARWIQFEDLGEVVREHERATGERFELAALTTFEDSVMLFLPCDACGASTEDSKLTAPDPELWDWRMCPACHARHKANQ